MYVASQSWSPRERLWPRGRPRGQILKSLALASKVKSLALALASRPQVLKKVERMKDFLENVFLWRSPENFLRGPFFFGDRLKNFCLKTFYWNDRRSRRVFLCFYSAIFQLTSARFQTFAYNSRTVSSSYMKFGQQFDINELYVSTQFRGNRLRDFGFRTRKPPRKFGVKSGFSQKRLKYGKNIS